MISSKRLVQIAAYGVSLPAFSAASPKLAKETVYMPSRVAALVLGTGKESLTECEAPRAGEVVKP